MVSAVYIVHWPDADVAYLRCELLLHRDYHNDVPEASYMVELFANSFKKLSPSQRTPILCVAGVHFMYYTGDDDLLLVAATRGNVNALLTVTFLHRMYQVLLDYFKQENTLTREDIVDNYPLIFELLDECMDFGMVQLTDSNILKEYIKVELRGDVEMDIKSTHNRAVQKETSLINSAIVRTQALAVSWRPKGIFYAKNEIYIDIVEHCDFIYDLATRTVKRNEVNGTFKIRLYLSGMPVCKLGLNEKHISQVEYEGNLIEDDGEKRLKVPLQNVQFHQCVQLTEIYEDNLIYFTPPDDKFTLLTYKVEQLRRKDKRPPLLIDPHFKITSSENKLQVTCSLTPGFKKRLHCKKLIVRIPISSAFLLLPNDDGFRYKSELGAVHFQVDQSLLLWAIEDLPGANTVRMMAEISLKEAPSPEQILLPLFGKPDEEESAGADLDKYYGVNGVNISLFDKVRLRNETGHEISVEFEIPMLAYSGLKVTYLRVDEELVEYTCFPWVRYVTEVLPNSDSSYKFRLSRDSYEFA